MATPLLLAVDDDERCRCAVDRELRNRYEPDYEVISMGSAEGGSSFSPGWPMQDVKSSWSWPIIACLE